MTDKAVHVQKDVRRPMRKTVNEPSGGFSSIPDGYETSDIEVVVDMGKLARHLGPRAMRNKRGFSLYIEGIVTVTVRNRRRINA